MCLKKQVLLIMYCLLYFSATAQDTFFSQQYANRLYLNPAFAGLNHDWSISFAHRNQWPALNGAFITNQLTADLQIPDTKSAISLMLQQDKAGIGGLQKLMATAGYAYNTPLTETMAFSVGLQVTGANMRIDYNNLVFGDQLSENGQVAVTSSEANTFDPSYYIDFTVGGLIFTKQAWLGLTAAHLNRPDYGFGDKTQLPIRFTANAGYKFYVSAYETNKQIVEFSITPAITFSQQKKINRLDVGLHTNYTPVSLGLLYKGVPLTANQEQAIAVIAGLQLKQVKIGFSHDVGISDFNRQSGGANEISVVFEQISTNHLFRSRLRPKISPNITCPAF